jgi:hypothetical protein
MNFSESTAEAREPDCKIEEQDTTIAELRSEIRNLAAMVNEQASELRKVRGTALDQQRSRARDCE